MGRHEERIDISYILFIYTLITSPDVTRRRLRRCHRLLTRTYRLSLLCSIGGGALAPHSLHATCTRSAADCRLAWRDRRVDPQVIKIEEHAVRKIKRTMINE